MRKITAFLVLPVLFWTPSLAAAQQDAHAEKKAGRP